LASTGTWSFDLLANGWTVVYFVGNSQQVLVILFTGEYYYVQRINVVNNTYFSVTFLGKASAWQHLNITQRIKIGESAFTITELLSQILWMSHSYLHKIFLNYIPQEERLPSTTSLSATQ